MATKPPRERRPPKRPREDAAAVEPEPAAAPRPPSPAANKAPTADKATAVGGILTCAAACGSAEARERLHAVVRAVRRGAANRHRMAALDAAIAAALEEVPDSAEDRWACAEAAAWALARLTRRRPAAGSAGRHLERLVAAAHAGVLALAERDTRPARFGIVLARLFGDVEACRAPGPTAAAALAEEIGRLVTDDGAVVLSGSAAVVERVVRWTAARAAARALGGTAWDADTERRWKAAAIATLRLLGGRGRAPGTDGPLPAPATAPLLAAAREAGGGKARRTTRRLERKRDVDAPRGRLLPPDRHDASAAVAVMRSGWGPADVRVLIEYRDATPRLEIAVADRLLVDGDCGWSTTLDGRPLDAEGAWTVSGWESDRKAAFLEIAAPLAGGMRLERQVVVLRRERIVLLADAVVPTADSGALAAGELVHRITLPLAKALDTETAAETREVFVYDGSMRLMALPLGLAEWRGPGRGDLAAAAGRLVLGQSGRRRLYAPLWLDCDPRRIGLPLTWRQLTVADTRRNLPPHQAAGFRVQAGHEQWLLYRALDAPRNRTLLGCNVSSGFLLGRIKRSGAVARTVEID